MDQWCKECKQITYVISDNTTCDIICTECGLVLEERYADSYNINDKKQKEDDYCDPYIRSLEISNPVLKGTNLDLSTEIHQDYQSLAFFQNSQVQRENSKNLCLTPFEKNLQEYLNRIEEIGDVIGIEWVHIILAHEICRLVHEKKTITSKNRDATAAACLFVSCNEKKRLPAGKICSAFDNLSINEFKRNITSITKLWKEENRTPSQREVLSPAMYMKRFCSFMSMSNELMGEAIRISQITENMDLRRNPILIAAVVLYYVSDVPCDTVDRELIEDIRQATSVSSKTIIETFKDLLVQEELILQN